MPPVKRDHSGMAQPQGQQAAGPFIKGLSFPGALWLQSPAVEKPADVTPDTVMLLQDKAHAAMMLLGAVL